jgi:ATP-dependent Zn protease
MMTGQQEVSYDQFRQHLADKAITEVTIREERIYYKLKDENDEEAVHNVVRLDDPDLTKKLLAADVKFEASPPSGAAWRPSWVGSFRCYRWS